MAQGSHDAWAARALLPEPAGPDQLSGVLLLDRAAAHPGLRQAAPKPVGLSRPPEPSHPDPNRITAAHNPKRRTADRGAFAEAVVFLSYFDDLPDPRQRGKVVYPLDEVLLLALL